MFDMCASYLPHFQRIAQELTIFSVFSQCPPNPFYNVKDTATRRDGQAKVVSPNTVNLAVWMGLQKTQR